MIERFEVGKHYRWTHSEPGYIWSRCMTEGLMGGRVALCTWCDEPNSYDHDQCVEFDIVEVGCWWYKIYENKHFEEVVEEYL